MPKSNPTSWTINMPRSCHGSMKRGEGRGNKRRTEFSILSLSLSLSVCPLLPFFLPPPLRFITNLQETRMPLPGVTIPGVTRGQQLRGAGVACWLERQTRDQKGCEFESQQERLENFLLQDYLCVVTLVRCPFHPRVTAVTRKRPRSFCQKFRWQVIPKHVYTLGITKSEWADYAAVRA